MSSLHSGSRAFSDNELVKKAGNGCSDSFEELLRRYENRVYGFLRRQTGHAHDAEDLTQQTFVAAFRALSRFREGGNFAAWLFTIAGRLAISHFRRKRVTEELPENLPAPPDAQTCAQSNTPLWDFAKSKLSARHYQVLWLHYAEDFSVNDIAHAMSISRVHVKVLLHRARRTLAGLLENDRSKAEARISGKPEKQKISNNRTAINIGV